MITETIERGRPWGFRARVIAALVILFILASAGIFAGFNARKERNELLKTFSRTWKLSEDVDLFWQQFSDLHRQFTFITQTTDLQGEGIDPIPDAVRATLLRDLAKASDLLRDIESIKYEWMSLMLDDATLLINDWRYVAENMRDDFVGSLTRLATEAAPRAERLFENVIPDVHTQIVKQLAADQQRIVDLGNNADRILILALIMPLTFFMLISFLVVRRVLGSLNKISRGINNYAAGDFSHRVTIDGDDEFSEAARQINMMADQRQQATDAINQMNATLEAKVQQRTAEVIHSRERLTEAQRIAKVGSWELDLIANNLVWSDEVFRIFELNPEQFGASYEAFLSAIHPDDREMVNEAYTHSLKTRTPYQITHRLRMVDGRIKHVEERCETEFDPEGKPLVSHGTIQDITEQMRAEEAIREKDIINRQVINTSLDSVVIIDDRGLVVDWNSQAENTFGWPREEILGLSLGDTIIPHKYRDAHRAGMRKFLATGEGPVLNQRLELTALTREGKEFPIELAISPMKIGDRYTFSAFIRDLTSRKESEAERELLQSQLTQSQKMEAIGRLAGGVAHDFNNMLSVILGYTDIAASRKSGDARVTGDLKEIRSAAERASGITRQLLAFARKQTVAPKLLDLDEIVNGMMGMLRRLLGEDVQLRWVPGKESHPVLMDPSQVDQILVNLCVNARDAIATAGQITIETGVANFSAEDARERSDIQAGNYVTLSVSDNGCGMDKDTLRVIFEPFFTTKGKGTGLGLPTVYGIVRQNKGFINVYSEPGIGTKFCVYLLKAQSADKESGQEMRPVAVAEKGAGTILIVEDEPAILMMIQHMLESLGYKILTAGLPSVALELAAKHKGEINLLLSDVIMPEINGRELSKKIEANHPGLKVLFMSGYTSDFIDKHGVLEEGVNFIQKPFSPADLAAKIRSML